MEITLRDRDYTHVAQLWLIDRIVFLCAMLLFEYPCIWQNTTWMLYFKLAPHIYDLVIVYTITWRCLLSTVADILRGREFGKLLIHQVRKESTHIPSCLSDLKLTVCARRYLGKILAYMGSTRGVHPLMYSLHWSTSVEFCIESVMCLFRWRT